MANTKATWGVSDTDPVMDEEQDDVLLDENGDPIDESTYDETIDNSDEPIYDENEPDYDDLSEDDESEIELTDDEALEASLANYAAVDLLDRFGQTLEEGITINTIEELTDLIEDLVKEQGKPKYQSKEGEAFDKYIAQGGSAEQFFVTYYTEVDYESLELNTVQEKANIVREYLIKTSNLTQAQREKYINKLGSDDLDSDAYDAQEWLIENAKLEKENVLINQEQAQQQANLEYQKGFNEWKQSIVNDKDILGYDVSEKERAEYIEFLSKPDKKTGKTKYAQFMESSIKLQRDLPYIAYMMYTGKSPKQKAKSEALKVVKTNINRLTASSSANIRQEGQRRRNNEVQSNWGL